MTAPRVYRTEAIVLKRIKLGEADRILTLYTPYLGKFSAAAKGVRRPKSRLGGHVELLTHSMLLLARGKNLDIITQSQTIDSFMPLRNDLWRVSCAIYAAELVGQFTAERVENYLVFRLLLNTLGWLCQTQDGELTLRYFELHLLGHLGYRPELGQCVSCSSPLKLSACFFSSSGGGVLCTHCRDKEPIARPLSPGALGALNFLQNSGYAAASRLKMSQELSLELEQVMRGYIRYLLEREVKSVAWLDRLRREGVAGGQD